MQRAATHPARKQGAGAAVVAGNMPTPAACLGGMSRVNRNHRATPFLGLVPDKPAQLRERPGVDTTPRFRLTAHPGAFADVFEVFQHQCRAWLD